MEDARRQEKNSGCLFRKFQNGRLFLGASANAYSQAVTLVLQFATVPLLLSAWGTETYGLWLIISTVPAYFALADFGFSGAAANDMTLAVACGKRVEARETFQSVLALNAIVSLALVVIVLLVVLLIPTQLVPTTSQIGSAEVRLVWILLTIQVAATLSCGAFAGGFQSSGLYSLGVFLTSSARLLECLALITGACLFHRFVFAALLMVVIRFGVLTAMAVILMRVAPWLRLGFGHASFAIIRRLSGPAFAATALPAGFALSLQGFVLVVGATLSLDAVAAFSTVRTLTRSVIQAGGIVNHAIMPEVTLAFGGGDFPRLRRLIRFNIITVISLNGAAFAAVVGVGSWIITLWTRGRIIPDPTLIIGLAAVASIHAIWLSQANLILAVNRHAEYSYWFLVVSLLSVIGAIPAAHYFGVNGLLLPLITCECVMVLVVARAFRGIFIAHKAIGASQTLSNRAIV